MALSPIDINSRLSTAFSDDNLLNEECKKLALDIQSKSIHLVTVVEALEPFITSKRKETIVQSVLALTQILSHLPNNFLTITEMKVLLIFYTQQLKNAYSILSTLKGILILLQMNQVPTEQMNQLFVTMFSSIHCQNLQRIERHTIFLILKYVINNKSVELKPIEEQFVSGVMDAIDGERDPRNLCLLFELLPIFLNKFSLSNKEEDMFEIIACYFPVDYNPKENDESNITRDMLADALSCCLYAIPEFAQYCLPIIIEKMESNLKVAKTDSLKLLKDSISTFGVDGVKPFTSELWVSLKETALSSDPEIKSLALEAITNIMKIFSNDPTVRENICERVIDDTKWTLSNVQLSSFWSSERILEAVAKAEPEYCKKILKFIVPLCLGQYSTKTSLDEKIIILKTLHNFLNIALEFDINIQSLPELSWTDIPALLIKELESPNNDIKIEAINCFDAQRKYINPLQRNNLYNKMCTFIETGNDALKDVALIVLEHFAKIYPKEISDIANNKLNFDSSDINVQKRRLEALTVLAKESEIGHLVLPNLLEIAASSSVLNDVALECLNKVLCSSATFNVHQFLFQIGSIDKLLSIDTNLSNDRLKFVSNISRSIIRKLSTDEQQKLFDKHSSVLKNELTNNCALFFEAFLIPLNGQVIISTDVGTYFDKVTKLAMYDKNPITRLSSCKLIAVLIHKLLKTDFIQKYIVPLRESLLNILKNDDQTLQVKHAAVIFHTWITKSAVIGGISDFAKECMLDQIDFLRHHEVGEFVAEEFKTLIDKNEDTITRENGCKIMFLYKQRVFESLLAEDVFDGAERRNFLIALTTALQQVPIELLFIHIKTIVPILAESLTLNESKLLLPILNALKLLIPKRHQIFMHEAKIIIPHILELVTHAEMKIRIAAIECLNNYCEYPSMAVFSFKPDVLDKLGVSVDDHKRLVRKIAVVARSRWFLYEQPITL